MSVDNQGNWFGLHPNENSASLPRGKDFTLAQTAVGRLIGYRIREIHLLLLDNLKRPESERSDLRALEMQVRIWNKLECMLELIKEESIDNA